jgi:chromate reductase
MRTPILTVAPAGTWNLDPVHSRVDFEVRYLAGTFKGEFHEIGAELTVDGERASLEGTARVASVDVKDENLSAHLQSPDFFDVERNPDLRFAAPDIRLDGDGNVSVDGELTIKGVTKPVTVTGTVTAPIVDPYGNDRIGLNLTTKIDRTDFGIDWNNPLPSGEPSLAKRCHGPRRAAVREAGRRNELVTQILGISGSLRRDSYNTALLRAAGEAAGPDVELELYDGLREVPPYDEDDDVHPRPESVARLNEAIANAEAVLFSTPEYNASIPGHLKNAIDWVSRPVATNVLRNKPVAVVGASTGAFGAVWAQAELRKVLAALGARVLDVELPVPHAHTRFDEGGLTDDGIQASLVEAVEALAAQIRGREGMQVVA